MLRKLILAAALAVLSAGLARAQVTDITRGAPESSGSYFNMAPYYERSRTPEEAGREVELERQYRETVRRIPDKKPSNDPWKSIRPATAAAPDRHRAQ